METPSWINEKEVSTLLGVTLTSLRRWRAEGRGPSFRKFNRLVRYERAAVLEWANKQPSGGDSCQD